jgi:hypothetical protein
MMNDALKELVIKAGAPEEVMEELWFAIFCQQFADLLIHEMEKSMDIQDWK